MTMTITTIGKMTTNWQQTQVTYTVTQLQTVANESNFGVENTGCRSPQENSTSNKCHLHTHQEVINDTHGCVLMLIVGLWRQKKSEKSSDSTKFQTLGVHITPIHLRTNEKYLVLTPSELQYIANIW
jgi:hypothetical protein